LKSIVISILICILIIASGFHALGEEWTTEQQEIINLEVKYWDSIVKDSDIDIYSKLLHVNVSAWPVFEISPNGKDRTTKLVNNIININLFNSYEIYPKGVNIYSDVAIIFYNIKWKGESPVNSSRVIHVWLKENGVWSMIGGMDASYDKLPAK
jgi:hypothetical protein